jgi:hypothetical protein
VQKKTGDKRKVARPLWFVKLVKMSFPGRFLLARMTHVSLFGKLIDRWLFQDDAIVYLPQDRVLQINAPVERAKEVVLPSQVLEHFIAKASYHWIMDTCICRDSSQCQDYPIDLGCLFLGEAAMGINPKLGRRVTKEQAFPTTRTESASRASQRRWNSAVGKPCVTWKGGGR